MCGWARWMGALPAWGWKAGGRCSPRWPRGVARPCCLGSPDDHGVSHCELGGFRDTTLGPRPQLSNATSQSVRGVRSAALTSQNARQQPVLCPPLSPASPLPPCHPSHAAKGGSAQQLVPPSWAQGSGRPKSRLFMGHFCTWLLVCGWLRVCAVCPCHSSGCGVCVSEPPPGKPWLAWRQALF